MAALLSPLRFLALELRVLGPLRQSVAGGISSTVLSKFV